jgi:hypothetical protein
VKNDGQQPLTIAASIIGTHATSFHFVGDAPTLVSPGDTVSIPIAFQPQIGDNFKVHSAQLHLETNDPAYALPDIVLKGLNAFGYEGLNEPSLDELTDAIGFPGIDTGATGLYFPSGSSDIMGDEATTVDGQRVERFKRADTTQPVVVLPLASYTQQHTQPGTVDLLAPNGATKRLMTFPADPAPLFQYTENQKLMPVPSSGVTSFPAGTDGWPDNFGFLVNGVNDSTHPSADCTDFRVYPAWITDTNKLPNTYIVATDLNCVNGDYNDYVFLVANVFPRA